MDDFFVKVLLPMSKTLNYEPAISTFYLYQLLTSCPSAKNTRIVLGTKLDVMHECEERRGDRRCRKQTEDNSREGEKEDMKTDQDREERQRPCVQMQK